MTPDPLPRLTIDEKRQAVYASLLRYAPEAANLRDRALRRVVLGALIGSSAIEPFRVGRIQQNLAFGADGAVIRTETIQKTLTDLQIEGKVNHTLLKERHAYFLTEEGDREIAGALVTAEELIDHVLDPLLRDADRSLSAETGAGIFKGFIFECFGRFGRTIAKQVAGTISREEMLRAVDARAAFEAAVAPFNLGPEQRDSMQARCVAFLRSSAPVDERLKFFLTQGYYFAHLLGLVTDGFDPLAEGAFSGSMFYLDTNVLVLGVLGGTEQTREFLEVLNIARRNGVELRVTQATLNELHSVAADRVPELQKIIDVLPIELVRKTNDQIVKAFLRAREDDPSITAECFMGPVRTIEERLAGDWPIALDGRVEDEIIAGRDVSEIEKVMREEAQAIRAWGKSRRVLVHDVASYFAVNDARATNPKVWFLTRDNSFVGVASRLQPDEIPFFYSHLGFIQSISPFVTNGPEEASFADVFSSFLSDQVRPIETLFDMRELSLMAEFHEDVMATPADQLLLAFDFVKNRTLDGKPYREVDIPRVSLELRKFLTSDREQQLRELELERQRISNNYESERARRIAAEGDRADELQRRLQTEQEVNSLRGDVARMEEQMTATRQRLEDTLSKQGTSERRRRQGWLALLSVGGFITAQVLWNHKAGLVTAIAGSAPQAAEHVSGLTVLVGVVATLLTAVPAAIFFRTLSVSRESKIALTTATIALSIALFETFSNEALSIWADRVGVAALAAIVLAAAFFRDD